MADSKIKRKRRLAEPPEIWFEPSDFQQALLAWYDVYARDLPWRATAGTRADPYRVWLSEIMLQQTTVKAVIPYYQRFLEKWPTVQQLAEASRDEVLAAWAGLGYYSRARNLHACAQIAAETGFPSTAAGLRQLSGVGPYTAAAIAAIAFGEAAAVVDGNVERVLARIFTVEAPLPAAKPELTRLAEQLTPIKRPGDYAQAMMDLGATVCTPTSPSCRVCPVQNFCTGFKTGAPQAFPRKLPKAERPTRTGQAFVLVAAEHGEGAILLRRRTDKGLLGGMFEVPGTVWSTGRCTTLCSADRQTGSKVTNAPSDLIWKNAQMVRHTFTHFHLELEVEAAVCDRRFASQGEWALLADLGRYALPTVMKKVIASAMSALYGTAQAIGSEASRASRVARVE